MMTYTTPLPKVLEIYLELAYYPILADRIRARMRDEIFARGVIGRDLFEREVEDKAVRSQYREGLIDPFFQESPETWERRKSQIRDHLTYFYFAYNLPHQLFDDILQETVGQPGNHDMMMDFNPELAPWDVLFAKGRQYEALPPEQQVLIRHHLKEIIVVLIKAMISDNLRFVGIAKHYLSVADLYEIRRRRIGRGKIGGKAAGMLLAWKILQRAESAGSLPLNDHITIPDSYYLGADVFYEFLELNDLLDCVNQKYKDADTIAADFQGLPARFAQATFPKDILNDLAGLLKKLGQAPLIVRSSSLLEDSFSTSFAGKYESVFCPNQGTPAENLSDLIRAISQVYLSAFNPDAMLYRQRMELVDYDERMAIMIQQVAGEAYRDTFFPTLAGVGFSRNPFLWTPRLKREDGFVRVVAGLGTRAVDRVADDYPRMIGLSHPTLRPIQTPAKIKYYAQRQMDLVNLAENRMQTVPVQKIIDQDFPWLRLLASVSQGGYIESITSSATEVRPQDIVLTLDGLVQRTDFVPLIKSMLKTLEAAYNAPVDIEFALAFSGSRRKPDLSIHLLQCRPQSNREKDSTIRIPDNIQQSDRLFTANFLIPNGCADRIRTIVYVDPVEFARLDEPSKKLELARVVGRLNRALENERFILIGPGRWGSSNVDLGVKVTYADIFNTLMLIEIGLNTGDGDPEVSYGTHFFQDLVEAHIYPLAVFPDRPGILFNQRFFNEAPNLLPSLLPEDAASADVIKVIDVPAVRDGQLLEVIMNGDEGQALAYFRRY